MGEGQQDSAIIAIRSLSRFYMQRIGVLQGGMLASPFPLTEARVPATEVGEPPPFLHSSCRTTHVK